MIRGKGARSHRFAESPVLKLALPAWRSRLVGLFLLGAFGVLIGRSFYLQIINNDFLQKRASRAIAATWKSRRRAARSPTEMATCSPFRRR